MSLRTTRARRSIHERLSFDPIPADKEDFTSWKRDALSAAEAFHYQARYALEHNMPFNPALHFVTSQAPQLLDTIADEATRQRFMHANDDGTFSPVSLVDFTPPDATTGYTASNISRYAFGLLTASYSADTWIAEGNASKLATADHDRLTHDFSLAVKLPAILWTALQKAISNIYPEIIDSLAPSLNGNGFALLQALYAHYATNTSVSFHGSLTKLLSFFIDDTTPLSKNYAKLLALRKRIERANDVINGPDPCTLGLGTTCPTCRHVKTRYRVATDQLMIVFYLMALDKHKDWASVVTNIMARDNYLSELTLSKVHELLTLQEPLIAKRRKPQIAATPVALAPVVPTTQTPSAATPVAPSAATPVAPALVVPTTQTPTADSATTEAALAALNSELDGKTLTDVNTILSGIKDLDARSTIVKAIHDAKGSARAHVIKQICNVIAQSSHALQGAITSALASKPVHADTTAQLKDGIALTAMVPYDVYEHHDYGLVLAESNTISSVQALFDAAPAPSATPPMPSNAMTAEQLESDSSSGSDADDII